MDKEGLVTRWVLKLANCFLATHIDKLNVLSAYMKPHSFVSKIHVSYAATSGI